MNKFCVYFNENSDFDAIRRSLLNVPNVYKVTFSGIPGDGLVVHTTEVLATVLRKANINKKPYAVKVLN